MWRATALFRTGAARRVALIIALVIFAAAPIVTTNVAAIGLWIAQVAALTIVHRSADSESRGVVFFSLCWLAGHTLFGVARWPAPLLISLGLFGVALVLRPDTRGLLARLRCGSPDRSSTAIAALLSLASVIGIFAWGSAIGRGIPTIVLEPALVVGVLAFAIVNAAGEEVVWRFFAWEAARRVFLPVGAVVAAQAISFGAAHFHGVPSGWPGVALATAFGAALGWLRYRTRGLAPPFAVHLVADIAVGMLAVR